LDVRRELDELKKAQADAERRTEMLTYQAEEIEVAQLQTGEDEELRQERDRLANAESLAEYIQVALTVLEEGTPESPSASDLIGEASRAMAGLAKLDGSKSEFSEGATELENALEELVHGLRGYLEEIEYNPKRLTFVEERLDLIQSLKRKYGGEIEKVITFGEDARAQLETINHASERIGELEAKEADLLKILAEQGGFLSEKRVKTAAELGKLIETELDDLRMAEAQFDVDFQTKPDPDGIPVEDGARLAFDQTGYDLVEFLVAPNPGEGLKPLVKVASGGETSRLMLALKNVLARADQIPTLIFDEIDQGIGGRVGLVVGHKLWNLARSHQVFCVTHLPQLAAFGDEHYQVEKLVEGKRTLTRVARLNGEPRLLELAQMLGEVSEGTLRSAHEILHMASNLSKATQP
jgi:DNA repair protein RecN (Recombination protein N)